MTKGWSQFVLDIDVTSETDVERVITIRRKIKVEFDRLGIEIPIKQRVVLLYKHDSIAPTEFASPQESHAGKKRRA
jgi:hypothetical protein